MARLLCLFLAAFAVSAHAQTSVPAKQAPVTPAPTAMPPAAAMPAPVAAPTPAPVNAGPRNPMKPPVVQPTPAATNSALPPGIPVQANGLMAPPPVGFNQPGMPTGQSAVLPPPVPEEEVNPIKAEGTRIGTLDGKAIYKKDSAYFFETKPEKNKK